MGNGNSAASDAIRGGPRPPGLLVPMANGAASDPIRGGASFGLPGTDGVCPRFTVGLPGLGFGFGHIIRGGAGTRLNIDPSSSETEPCSRFAIWPVSS